MLISVEYFTALVNERNSRTIEETTISRMRTLNLQNLQIEVILVSEQVEIFATCGSQEYTKPHVGIISQKH